MPVKVTANIIEKSSVNFKSEKFAEPKKDITFYGAMAAECTDKEAPTCTLRDWLKLALTDTDEGSELLSTESTAIR